jgi:multiple sugar transport system permease protein
MMPNRNRRYTLTFLRLAVAALFLAPLLWAVAAALRPTGTPLSTPFGSAQPTLDSFVRLFRVLPIGRFTFNSLRVVALAVPLTLITASWAGYAIARLPRFSQRRWVLLSLLMLMVPGVALWPARFLLYMGSSPFFVLMFYRAFRRIPPAIYDAARIDGAGALDTWRRVALPIVRPTAVAVAILTFILYWGDFLSPLLYLSDAHEYTLPVGLELLEQLGRTDYPLLMAGAVWATLLPLALLVTAVGVSALKEKRLPPVK